MSQSICFITSVRATSLEEEESCDWRLGGGSIGGLDIGRRRLSVFGVDHSGRVSIACPNLVSLVQKPRLRHLTLAHSYPFTRGLEGKPVKVVTMGRNVIGETTRVCNLSGEILYPISISLQGEGPFTEARMMRGHNYLSRH